MKLSQLRSIFASFCLVLLLPIASAASTRMTHNLAIEQRIFTDNPQWQGQLASTQASFILGSDISYRSKDRKLRAQFIPYLRLDERDAERSYFDVREASVIYRIDNWEFMGGIGQVFWGVNESKNPVDIINQFDTIEDVDEVEKLGQPMLRVGHRATWGNMEFYYLPVFRERKFAGEIGRLRLPFKVSDNARYERGGDEYAGDFALRYTKRFGDYDLGLHTFHGTSRAPAFTFDDRGVATPIYQELSQGGIDLQYTKGPWLLKAEVVYAEITHPFWSIVSGFEYTLFDIYESGVDIGLITEYLFDDRDKRLEPANVFDDDVFFGTRITLNDTQDTEFLAGVIVDNNTDDTQGSLEFQRRIGNQYLLEIESRFFNSSADSLSAAFDQDDVVQARFTIYF